MYKKKMAPRTQSPVEGTLKDLDYKDIKFLSRFVTERGKILPSKITGLTLRQQKRVTKAIKRARQMGMLPFLNYSGGYNY